jgi:putative CocE/NonD family hydrolase
MVIGAHDGVPAGTGGEAAERARWYDRHLRGIPNGAESEPAVRLWLADGDREDLVAGRFVRVDGGEWPIAGTRWTPLALSAARSGTAASYNDGSLGLGPGAPGQQPYPLIPSDPIATDPHTTSLLAAIGGGGYSGNTLADRFPSATEMNRVEPAGLSYTTGPLQQDVVSAGPASLELQLTSTVPESDLFAVISDVHPDGSAHPVATGRLRSTYPLVDEARSLKDPGTGDIVQPYARFDRKTPTMPGTERQYRVELWPIGNRFRAGHRLRLHVLGVSGYHQTAGGGVNVVRVGGSGGSRLLLPVLPGSDLEAALAP